MFRPLYIDIDAILAANNNQFPPFIAHLNIKSNKCESLAYAIQYEEGQANKDLFRDPISNFPASPTHVRSLILVMLDEDFQNYISKENQFYDDFNAGLITQRSIGHCYALWDKQKDVCGIFDVCKHRDEPGLGTALIENIMDCLGINFPTHTTIWIGIDLRNQNLSQVAHLYSKAGFDQPFISYEDPFGFNWHSQLPFGFLAMHRFNDYIDPSDIHTEITDTEILYTISQYIKIKQYYNQLPNLQNGKNNKLEAAIRQDLARNIDICTIIAKFNVPYAKWLNRLVHASSTLNPDGSVSQKEISGAFWLDDPFIDPVTGRIVWEITVDKRRSINKTHAVDAKHDFVVEMAIGRYNFHTHPVEAYKRALGKLVYIGYPSGPDYITYLFSVSSNRTVFHCVISIEGIYTLSIEKYWCVNMEELTEVGDGLFNIKYPNGSTGLDYLKFKMDLPKDIPSGITPEQAGEQYCVNIMQNQLELFNNDPVIKSVLKGRPPIWNCQFITWKQIEDGTRGIEVGYPVLNDQCFATERSIVALKRLHPQISLGNMDIKVLENVDYANMFK